MGGRGVGGTAAPVQARAPGVKSTLAIRGGLNKLASTVQILHNIFMYYIIAYNITICVSRLCLIPTTATNKKIKETFPPPCYHIIIII